MTENKKKWELTIDFIMIIGKYLESNSDFINIMKVCKKYRELVLMYKFNPINDISLFENIQTQHFYNENDGYNKKNGMHQYIYWYFIDYKLIKNKKDNEIFKNIQLNTEIIDLLSGKYPLEIENGNCTIPEGITKIGYRCFYYCSELTNIILPSSLKQIGQNAFYNTNITTITIPEGITKIGNNCFYNCNQLTNIILPSSLKQIGDNAFYNTITTITIPKDYKINYNSFPDNCKVIRK